jgi:hypothetical protein
LPDGGVESLLLIDDWDFNWQDIYLYAKPVRLPKGTKLVMEAVHDNSVDNPRNPQIPPRHVRWGEQTFNEMSIMIVNLSPARETDMGELHANPIRQAKSAIVPEATRSGLNAAAPGGKAINSEDFAHRAADALRKADKDGNGKLGLDEIMASIGSRENAAEIEKRFIQFDRDGDKQLNQDEVAAALKSLRKP